MKIRSRYFLSLIASILSMVSSAQTYDEQIANAMNNSDWFTLDSIYSVAPKDSIHPFLEIYSRCLLGNRLNRPDVSIPAFQELFSTQSSNLDLSNLISSTFMFGMDLSRIGQNETAASMTNSVLEATRQYLDSVMVSNLISQANRYSALAAYNPYQIRFERDSLGIVPFEIVPVGPLDKGSVLMHLRESTINGTAADITFDTGAGTNLISPEMAKKHQLIPLEETRVSVSGISKKEGYIAIAKELKIGNITINDVPFTVVSMATDNSEADQYIDAYNIVLGSDLMLHLKDVTLNFLQNQITIPSTAPFNLTRADVKSNMCFSPTMNLMCNGILHNESMLMCIDSGDASFGSLGKSSFERNRQFIVDNGTKDTLRMAGIGGVDYSECYYVPNLRITLDTHTAVIPKIVVKTEEGVGTGTQYECNIGLRTLMLYPVVRFNLVDFVITTDPIVKLEPLALSMRKIPEFNFRYDKKPNYWQVIGMCGVSLTRILINPNAPNIPDL